MAITKMKFVKVSGPFSKLNKLINALCADGNFHPEPAGEYISQSMGYRVISEESPYIKILEAIRELSDEYGFDLEGEGKKEKIAIDDTTLQYIEEIGQRLQKFNSETKSLSEQLAECLGAIEKYNHFTELDVDLSEILDCKFIGVRFGALPKDDFKKLQIGYGDNPYILFYPCSHDEQSYWGVYFAPKDKQSEIDGIFASLHFERLQIPGAAGTINEIIENIEDNIKIIEEQKSQLDSKIKEIWESEGDKLKALYKKLSSMQKVFELRSYAVKHHGNCFFVGYVPQSGEKALVERVKKITDCKIEIEDPKNDKTQKPPVLLKNSIFTRPFSYFVEMYGLPSYNDLDITAFVAMSYTLLFGIMFGDVGQGIVLALAGLFMWKKMKMDLGKILVPCGISSMIFGFVFGSVFGFEEALNPLYNKIGLSKKPLEVMDSINTVLLFAIGIGVALVILAMVINIAVNVKRRKFGSALFSENGLAGIAVYVGGANLAYGFMAKAPVFSSKISVILLVVGVLILFNKELLIPLLDEGKLHKPESISDYVLQNLFECIEYILSYFSNTVSFLRVGAFVIVHASMMMVVFTLAGDPKSVSGIIVIILGNILVIALEGLLTGIQGLRLEFYEMFSRFFEGEGRKFSPIKLK